MNDMYQIPKEKVAKLLNLFLAIALIISLLGFFVDITHTIRHGGVDMRNRVVGARLLNRGLDPYYFKWSQGQDEKLLDPMDKPRTPVSRVTVPPSVLFLHTIIAELPYIQQRFLWLLIQWSALIGSLFFLTFNQGQKLTSKFLPSTVLLLISGSSFWRLHVDVGQIYILYVFLISASYYILQTTNKFRNILGGLLLGLAISLRFPLVVILLPVIIFKKFKLLLATVFSLCLCLLAFVVVTGQQVWISYFSAMTITGKLAIGKAQLAQNVTSTPLPSMIEGMNNLTLMLRTIYVNSSIQKFVNALLKVDLYSNHLIVIACVSLLIYSVIIYYSGRHNITKSTVSSWDRIFLVGSLMILILELFIPAPRYSYNNIQFLIPLFLLLKNLDYSETKSIILLSCLILSFLMMNGIFSWFIYSFLIGEWGAIVIMVVMSIRLLKRMASQSANTELEEVIQNGR